MTVFTWITFDGTARNDNEGMILSKSMSDDNSTSRLSVRFPNYAGINKTTFTEGDEVILRTSQVSQAAAGTGTKVFLGIITEISYEARNSVDEKIVLQCRDYTALLQQNTIEPEVYTNEEISVIITDLMTKYAPSSITTINVMVTGRTLSRITFNQISLFDAIKQLADFVDYIFYVDEDKDLHFEPSGMTSSGITLNSSNILTATFRRDIERVRNRVYVYGGRQLVAYPRQTFTADGTGSVFTLAENPHNTKITKSGTEVQGGVFNQNIIPATGIQYLVNFEDKQVVFISGTSAGNNIPTSGSQILADYQVSRPIIKLAEDNTSIESYQRRTEVIIDESISDPVTARDIAVNTIMLRKNPYIEGDIELQNVVSLTPGQTVIVNLPNENINNIVYNILEASYDFSPDTSRYETVLRVRVGTKIGDISDILKEIILNNKRLQAGQIDTTGILSRLITGTGSMGLKVSEWSVSTRTISNAFILSHPTNGKLGSPAPGFGGGQVVLGSDGMLAFAIQYSGGE